jgi:hypothetical protein
MQLEKSNENRVVEELLHEYELMMKAGNGEIASRVVAEFAIPIRALFDDEANRETLRSIL